MLQAPLEISLKAHYRLSDFVWQEPSSEQYFGTWLTDLKATKSRQLLVTGSRDSGKTHLLLATARHVRCQGLTARYEDCGRGTDVPTVTDLRLLCLDNVDCIAADRRRAGLWISSIDEHLGGGGNLLLAVGDGANTGIPDLNTRMRSGVTVQLPRLGTAHLGQALSQRAQGLGLRLSGELKKSIIGRHAADYKKLFATLIALDRHQLSRHKRLSVKALDRLDL